MLRRRIEQQAHWRQAEAVRDGRQPPVDPDSDGLQLVGEGIRLYTPRVNHGGLVYVCKRLVDGVWELGMLTEPWDGTSEPATVAGMARVA